MDITIEINSVDRTSDILVDSIVKEDVINDEKDTLSFRVLKYAGEGFIPEIGQEVEMTVDAVKEFGGVIVSVAKSISDGNVAVFDIECADYTHYLNRELVLERYEDKTVNYIIADIISKYATEFTGVNVDCDITIATMLFNRISVSECLEKLSKAVGYYWYVDYDKDIHFFAINDNAAPFGLTDSNGNWVRETLKITDDLSQIRNIVTVRGSDERGLERTETYTGTEDQNLFPLANKFAELPTVEVDGSPVDVGVDYLDQDDDYDCLWSFEQKSLRFKESMEGSKVEITGIPLFPILVKIPEWNSINEYGRYEFYAEDKSITSRAEAYKYAQAQLTAYKDGIIEGEFETNTAGLRSGQTINVNSELLGIDEDFLIQRVSFKILAKDKAVWSVELATMRTIGIIQLLQNLIRFREIKEFDPENTVNLRQFAGGAGITDAMDFDDNVTSAPYLYGTARYGFATYS